MWAQVKAKLPGHLNRIENIVSAGIPDVNACHQGREAWIELKVAKGNSVHFRSAQLAWFAKRLAAGGNIKVLYRKGDSLYVVPAKNVLDAEPYYQANADKSIRVYYEKLGGIKYDMPFSWPEIAETIYEPMS